MKKAILTLLSVAWLSLPSYAQSKDCCNQACFPFIATEKVIAESPDPKGIYLYTPAIVEGFNGRFIVANDWGGPGTTALDGPLSGSGDYKSGNQIHVYLSDDRGETWRETATRLPMLHEILFKTPKAIYMIGQAGKLVISRSDDNGETWTDPAVLDDTGMWHQSCGTVDIHNGKVTLVYEKRNGGNWPGVDPVLFQADENADLTKIENWKMSKPFNANASIVEAHPSGIPMMDVSFEKPAPGILEASVLRIYNEKHPLYDPEDKTVAILMRAETGFMNIGAILRGHENADGSLVIDRFHIKNTDLFYTTIPGGCLKFQLCYDPQTKLYWMVHSQVNGQVNNRRRLAVSYSPDLFNWTFAGMVAIGPSDNGARHYATMIISGDDMFIVSRSGDERAKNAHDNNLTTFHKIANFRDLIY